MKIEKQISVHERGGLPYEAPSMKVQNVELEYCVAAGSVQGSMTESWQTETQSQDVEW
ncbi:hypothetical protein [Sphingobacterium thalpophilum]|uniref:hypothetical protein n=1 Tax=Sphingobacterium thalpophilum TaxID=259 RepID=UPI003C71233F